MVSAPDLGVGSFVGLTVGVAVGRGEGVADGAGTVCTGTGEAVCTGVAEGASAAGEGTGVPIGVCALQAVASISTTANPIYIKRIFINILLLASLWF